MNYSIHITTAAERDLNRAADHIEFVLKNPKAADALLEEAEIQINNLIEFPRKFQLIDDPVLASWEIRFVIVHNYLAFYTIDEKRKLIIVVRFLFQRSNWIAILHQGFSLM